MESERLGTSDDVDSSGVGAVPARTTLAISGVEVSQAYRNLALDELGRSVFATLPQLDLAAALGNSSPVGRGLADAAALGGSNVVGDALAVLPRVDFAAVLGGSNVVGRAVADAASASRIMCGPDIRQLLEHVLGLVDAEIPRHLNTDAALAENWADGRADYALLATLPGSGFHIVGPGVA